MLATIVFLSAIVSADAKDDPSLKMFEFKDLSKEQQADLTKLQTKIEGWSQSCEAEANETFWKVARSLTDTGGCLVSLVVTYETKSKLAATTAVLACSGALISGAEAWSSSQSLSECKHVKALRDKYEEVCKDKSLAVFADKDILYCYQLKDEGAFVFAIDYSKKTITVRVPQE